MCEVILNTCMCIKPQNKAHFYCSNTFPHRNIKKKNIAFVSNQPVSAPAGKTRYNHPPYQLKSTNLVLSLT